MPRNARSKKIKATTSVTTQSQNPSQDKIHAVLSYYNAANFQMAENLASDLASSFPNHPFAWIVLEAIYAQSGRLDKAIISMQQSVRLSPNDFEAHSNLGNALLVLGRLSEAEASYREAIRIKPDFAEAHSNLGNSLKALGYLSDAEASYREAIRLKPEYAQAHSNLGGALKAQGCLSDAEASYREAIRLKPDYADAHSNLGNALVVLGRVSDAEASYREAIRLKPDFVEAHSNLGNALLQVGRLTDAEASYREAIRLKPEYAQAHSNLGNALQELGRLSDAEASYREAIRLKPDFAEAHSNLGNALLELGRSRDAEVSYREAIRLEPDYAQAHSNLGNALKALGRVRDAEASYREAIRLKPDFAEAKCLLAFHRLLQSDFDEGLQLYEWRWDRTKELKNYKRNFDEAPWLGSDDIKGKTLLVHAEQGLGDTIQFCRYIELVQQLGAEVIFEVQAPLVALLSHLHGVAKLIPKGTVLPEFDYHCPLMSLPLALKTHEGSIPASIPYLSAESDRVNRWQDHLGQHGYKIGICWQGAETKMKGRSVPISAFYALSQIPTVRLISLHKGDGEKALDSLPEGMRIETLGSEFDSTDAFLDTAAVMKCCDLVITIDTSVAHLAGALGVRTWVALKFMPEWRWLLDRSDSPWYPTMRLFRQKRNTEWQDVFDEMISALRADLDQV